MVDLIFLGGHGQPVLIVGSVLVVAVVLAGVHLVGAAVVGGGFAAIPFRGHFAKEVVEQVGHGESVFEDAGAGKYDGKEKLKLSCF